MKSQRLAHPRRALQAGTPNQHALKRKGSYLVCVSLRRWRKEQFGVHPVSRVDRPHVNLRKAMMRMAGSCKHPWLQEATHLQEGADVWQAELCDARPQRRAQVNLQHVFLRTQSVGPLQSQNLHVWSGPSYSPPSFALWPIPLRPHGSELGNVCAWRACPGNCAA